MWLKISNSYGIKLNSWTLDVVAMNIMSSAHLPLLALTPINELVKWLDIGIRELDTGQNLTELERKFSNLSTNLQN